MVVVICDMKLLDVDVDVIDVDVSVATRSSDRLWL